MAYADKFDREVILDLDEATELAVRVVMKEGELRFRESLASALKSDIDKYLSESDGEINQDWVDGVYYVVQTLKEGDLDGPRS